MFSVTIWQGIPVNVVAPESNEKTNYEAPNSLNTNKSIRQTSDGDINTNNSKHLGMASTSRMYNVNSNKCLNCWIEEKKTVHSISQDVHVIL